MKPFYVDLDRDAKLKNPNIQKHLYVALNTNRNAPRVTNTNIANYQHIPANNSVDLYKWLEYLTKIDSPISRGSFTDDTDAAANGVNLGELYYNTTNNRLTVRLT